MTLCPPLLKFRPILLDKPWGGDALWRVLRKGHPGEKSMGESWELSDRAEACSAVEGGPLQGTSLRDLLARYREAILGEASAEDLLGESGHFPLLYKFISARQKLSVQVHPSTGSLLGEAKTECWYVVDAEPGAELIVGVVSKGKTRGEILERLKSPRCEEVLHRWPVKKGDVFFIPAGTVHAITEGLLLYEVQQNSDTTFRLYDWGRVDAKGNPRALHLEEAAEVADLQGRGDYQIPSLRVEKISHAEDYLVACPYFALVKWHGFKKNARLETHGKFRVLTVVSGSFTATTEEGEAMPLELGDTVLIPACLKEVRLDAGGPDAEIIVSFVPDMDKDVREPLRHAGYGEKAVKALSGPALP